MQSGLLRSAGIHNPKSIAAYVFKKKKKKKKNIHQSYIATGQRLVEIVISTNLDLVQSLSLKVLCFSNNIITKLFVRVGVVVDWMIQAP